MPPPDPGAALALLGLPEDATEREVRRAYRRLAKSWHPDVLGPDGARRAESEERMKGLNAAYAVAREAARRRPPTPARRPPAAPPAAVSRPARPGPTDAPSPPGGAVRPARRERWKVEVGALGRLSELLDLLRRTVALLPAWLVPVLLLAALLALLLRA